jgi:hypothetical protein
MPSGRRASSATALRLVPHQFATQVGEASGTGGHGPLGFARGTHLLMLGQRDVYIAWAWPSELSTAWATQYSALLVNEPLEAWKLSR